MDNKQAKILIQKTFNDSFDKDRFIRFVRELLNEIDEGKAQSWNKQYVKHDFHDGVKRYERIGTYTAPEGEKIDILIVYLEKDVTLERARTLQRNFVAYHLKKRAEKEAGLVAFVPPSGEDWRFSLVKMEYHLEQTQEGKVKVEEDLTPAKRFSFIVGKNENSHTAQKQLLPILEDDKNNPTLKEIEKAFSIEAVTKEFFNKYKDLFLNFKEEFDKILEKDKKITEDFSDKGINTADFAKKLLGQIVFLYFLQRKGWLGVDKNSNWGSGPKNFLRALFEKKYCNYENFFNDVLEPLFYRALATDRGEQAYDDRFDCRIPFLNGGLFEPIQDYDWINTDIIIPNDLFSNNYKTKEGDIGSGILDFFDRYNFTIKEDEPLEKEVAIDPEMLGKVFENLLEIKDRKSKGAYYTPREIVHYMCQESLINYLATESDNKLPREDIETFIHLGDFAVEHDMAKTQGIIKDDGKYKLPQSIHENAELIDRKLAEITVCDPAIGSGAFPVGMMNEIIRARGALNATKTFKDTKSKRTPYSFKRHAIQNSLYGVDIDPGAVEIAKLRLWLSLVVDEEEMTEIKPLPNLDYKIMQGNSLLEEYEGIKLFDESLILDTGVEKKKRREEIARRKSALQQEYFKLHSEGKLNEIRKSEIEKGMKALQKEESALTKVETGGNSSLFDQESIAKKKAEALNRLHKEFFDMALKSNKAEIKKQIDELEWELIEETLKEHGKEKELPKLQALRRSNNKPFFLWKLHFAEVFQKKGGFDVVIANPPYLRVQGIGNEISKQYKNLYRSATGKYDLYVLFVELAITIGRQKGIINFIMPDKWTNSAFGIGLREMISKESYLYKLISFGAYQVFNASTYTSLVWLRKENNPYANYIALNTNLETNTDLEEFLALATDENFCQIKSGHFNEKPWILAEASTLSILMRLKENKKNIKDEFKGIFQGIVTTGDDIFYLSGKLEGNYFYGFSQRLKKEIVLEADIVKPLLMGDDIPKYAPFLKNKVFVIYPHHLVEGKTIVYDESELKKKYPKAFEYLLNFKEELIEKKIKYKTNPKYWFSLHRAREIDIFEHNKIITPYLALAGSMTIDENNFYTNAKCYSLIKKENADSYKFYLAILNSKLLSYYLRATGTIFRGGYLAYTSDYLYNFPLPDNRDKQLIIQLEKIVEEIFQEKRIKAEKGVLFELESNLNKLVYELYGLTPTEIQIVEKSLSQ